jgi:hypothetical protein
MAAPKERRDLASIDEVSAYFGLSVRTLHDQHARAVEVGALAFRVGRHLRWDWADIDKFVEAQKRQPVKSPKRRRGLTAA